MVTLVFGLTLQHERVLFCQIFLKDLRIDVSSEQTFLNIESIVLWH